MPNHPLLKKNDFGPTPVGNKGRTVETWWDRSSRNWVTQTKDNDNIETREASYDGTRESAARSNRYHREHADEDED